ncbi:hypothetical protein M408DRAFT_327087 [Serendipita vermifera MAFF 305830]|uniref:Uncharacterized protein n=1 Tax=Serendipita vermifera MAFF 305830 TaxID=933852 RepID=A0A0C3BJE8_SERVB|nr:hypothetical protein M408DRAFT_327087 [Serendipita vermifera MAFF 305830]
MASAPPGVGGDAVVTAPLAPSFDEVDEWDAARQLQIVDASTTSSTRAESVEAPPPSVNAFPALPPPPTSTSSLSADVTSYRLGAVWTGLNAPAARALRAPSAPPLDAPGLLPSAPPPVEDDDQVASAPSAPPAWDDEELEGDGTASTEQRVENAQNQSANHETSHEPRAQMVSANGDSDGDGTDSTPNTPPNTDAPRWSDTFRTRAQERVGLPRYEP